MLQTADLLSLTRSGFESGSELLIQHKRDKTPAIDPITASLMRGNAKVLTEYFAHTYVSVLQATRLMSHRCKGEEEEEGWVGKGKGNNGGVKGP